MVQPLRTIISSFLSFFFNFLKYKNNYLFKYSWYTLYQLNKQQLYYPNIPLLGIYPTEMKTYAPTKTCT